MFRVTVIGAERLHCPRRGSMLSHIHQNKGHRTLDLIMDLSAGTKCFL